MKRKFTFLIAAAVMLLTMMATTGEMWGQTRTEQTASYGFESGDAGWTATSFVTNNTAITAHGGSKYGATNGSSTANVAYNTIVANPQSLTCYYSKTTTNTNAGSHFEIQVSTNNSTWTTVESGLGMNEVTKGTWYELTADLSSYSDVYVRVYYTGTSAVRALDDITLTYDDGQSPSTDPEISFSPASITLDEVLVGNQASTTFSVSQANLTSGITLSVDNGSLSPSSIAQGAAATAVTWTYTPTTAGAISATVTATSGETTETLAISGTAIAPVEGYDVDFEYATNMYPNWTFNNMTTYQTGSITAHGGTYYGTTGGKSTASITTTSTVANPGTLTCYVSKQSNNTTSSTWYIQVSSNGSSWTDVETQDATSMSQGTWVEFSADLSSYSDVYVRVYYSGSTAVRNIDDLSLTVSNTLTVTYNANGATSGAVPTDNNEYESGDVVTVLGNTGSLAKAGYTFGGWNTQADGLGTNYTAGNTFEITSNTTLYAKWNAKAITSLSYTGTPTKTEYASGESFDPTGLTVTATFNDESQEDVTTSVVWTPDPLTTGTTSVTGTYMGQTINVTGLTVTAAPGTEDNPYTVAQARAAIDAGTGVTGVYATGIVSEIVTAYGTGGYNNVTFNMVDEAGDEVFLQAFRCVGDDAPNVLVNDVVVVSGNLTKYGQTYEFAQGCSVVSLEHPATPYITANDVEITYDATAGSIAYTIQNPVQGGQVTAATTSTWLTLGTEFASPIAFTCAANTAANSRTATVTLTYTYGTKTTVNKEVTVTQAGNPEVYNNISDITAVGTAYSVKGTVVAINSRGFVMGDGTGYVYYYKGEDTGKSVGNKVKVTGTTGTYGQIIQFTNTATVSEATSSSYNNTPAATVITAVPDYSTGYHLSTYLEFEGALEKSSSNYFITLGESQIQISYPTTAQSEALTALDGKTVHVKGYFSGINSSSKFTVMLESAEEVAVPSITLAQYEYNLNADGGNAELLVTYTNMPANPQAEVIFYEANGTTTATYDWITASINANYNIAGHINVNEGDARSAYFKVKGKDANNNDVYSNLVTINQATPAAPSISFTQASMSLIAGGEQNRQLSFDYSGLGSNPTFTINYYEQDGTTAATYNHDWLTATIANDKLNVTAEANDGEARTVYLKVYGEKNANVHAESNLVTITQAAYVVDYATLPFGYGGGVLSDFSSLNGTSYSLNDNGSYNETHAPYRIKFTKTGDYLQVKTNERPGIVTIGVKMVGGGTTSTITVQGSADGETFTNIQTLEISGSQNDIVNLATTNSFAATDRYVRLYFTKGSNVGVGPITIAQVDNTPSITAEDVNIAYDATGGSIAYTINNPVEGGSMSSMPISGGDWLTVGGPSNGNVALTCEQNTGAERTATVRLTYTYNNTKEAVTKDVTVTQAAAPAVMYTVNFTLDGGTFVSNDDFTDEIVEIAAGTYSLPSATKAGYDFTGWNDGDQTYAAGDEYTVSADVDFTALWTESTTTTGTIAFGSASGSTPINSTSVTGDDSLGNEWTITTVFSGETSFTQNANYSQVGASSKPATSITFTMTLPQQKTISAFEAKFGGFSNTAGDINLYVGETNVGSGELDGTTDVIVEATTTTEVGTVLTVTVTNIDKGVKCYYISYTLSDAPVVPVINPTANPLAYNATTGSIDYTIDNYEEGTMTAASEADWISNINVEEADEIGIVTFNVTANTSNESRSATVTLTFTYGNPAATVTKDVTVTQNGQPSITVTPATANVAFAGSAPEFAVTYESLEIDDADDFDVEFYETSTSTTAGTQPTWITNVVITGNTTDGFTLTVTVAANNGAARDAYLKVYAAGDSDYIYSNIVTISQAAYTQLATYSLVTSVNQIVSGKHYLIASGAANGTAYAMGYQKDSNRNGVAVTVNNGQIAETENVYEFVINTHLNSNNEVDYYTIYDAVTPGYLYASSSSANQLKTTTTLNDNGKWAIEISSTGAATITAQGSNSRNLMRYNPNNNNPIFACYATNTTTGNAPCLYVKDNDVNFEYYGGEVAYPENSIPDGGSITVSAGSVLTVPTGFTNTDPNAFIIQDGGQVIYNGNGTFNATLQNNITAYSNEPGVSDGWYLIASPVDNLPTSAVGTGTYDLFVYNEPTAYWWVASGHDITSFERGQGYLYANSANQLLAYAGTMGATNENIEKQLSYTSTLGDDVRGFNLVGNPFTRNIKLGDMELDEATLTQFYVMNAARTGLQSIDNASYEIKPGEGFFVQADDENQTLEFNPTSKGLEDIKFIKIVAGNENGTDNAYINIGCGNTLRKMNIADLTNVYVMNEDKDFAAARIEELAGTMPVNFEAVEDGEYTITVEAKFIEAHSMHLIDNFTGADIDLMVEPSYTFNATANDNAERFTLVFDFNNYTGCNENYTSENFIYQNGDEIIVNGEGELQVFDVLGRFVMSQNVSGVERISKPAQTGVYIFMMNGNAQKIVVK